ncbi:hypothetical protein EJ06DRAFT_530633 [Trichodelitschia bisporula]|uniref:Uncharacterized protein n=1 Tax=Trichodelitschia bisporula TaxID=703511 RepID=A0A6G1HUU7_9PEZI|nr:hypothetical protein EJ06DRAFT_530633 [Trichodelitschia bisporula]
MSRSVIAKHYARIAAQWPKDPLRPTVSFQKLLEARAVATEKLPVGQEAVELRNVNALYSLLDDRYAKKYPIPPRLLNPTSNPTHYQDLITELEEAPNRTWLQRLVNRWKGVVRFS